MNNLLLQPEGKGTISKAAVDNHAKLDAFMNDLWSQTYGNPFNNHERVWNNAAAFECRPFWGNIHLSSIRSLEKGTGQGSAALKWFCQLADKHGVTIELDAVAFGEGGLSVNKLRSWYMRNGFMPDKRTGIDTMTRSPKGAKQTLKLTDEPPIVIDTSADEEPLKLRGEKRVIKLRGFDRPQ